MSTIKDKVTGAAGAVVDAAKTVGHKIAEGAVRSRFLREGKSRDRL